MISTRKCTICNTDIQQNKCNTKKYCTSCRSAVNNKRSNSKYHANKEYYSTQRGLSRKFGTIPRHKITVSRYEELVLAQKNRCAICHTDNPGTKGRWAIDHDRTHCPGITSCEECIRGLLCSSCNAGLGMLGDNLESLERATSYLRAHEIYNPPKYLQERQNAQHHS